MGPSDIAAALRSARPVKLRVVLNDETEKAVAMPRGRQRWDRAATTIDELPWATIYFLDGQGAIVKTLHRDDGAPAGELESLPKNPTLAIVQACIGSLAPVLRDVHKVAATTTLELVTKVRAIHKEELKDIIAGYTALLEKTLERNTAFEERSNQLMAENDALRDELAETRVVARESAAGGGVDERREAMLMRALGVDVPAPAPAPAPGTGGGGHGGNGVG